MSKPAKVFSLSSLQIHPDLPFGFSRVELDKEDFIYHGHEFTELVILIGGKGVHEAQGVTYPVSAGDVFVIHRGLSHGFRQTRKLSMYNIAFLPTFFEDPGYTSVPGFKALFFLEPLFRREQQFAGRLILGADQMKGMLEVLRRMEHEVHFQPLGFRRGFEHLLGYTALLLARCYEENDTPQAVNLVRMAEVLSVLEDGFLEDRSISAYARQAGYSVNQFERICKKVYGLSPLQYVHELRLKKACTLLRQSSWPVTRIAGECGYNDSNYFTRVFRRRFSVSPRQYRRDHNRKDFS